MKWRRWGVHSTSVCCRRPRRTGCCAPPLAVDDKLHGCMFATLERIGGTPCVLLGLISVSASSKRDQVLKGLMNEAFHRALMAFPDEDVVVGSRFVRPDALEAFKQLDEMIPRPEHRAVGEERAWGRRLARRFGVDANYDEQTLRRQDQRPERLHRPRVAEARQDRRPTWPRCSPASTPTRAARSSSTAGPWPRTSSSWAPGSTRERVRRRRQTAPHVPVVPARPGRLPTWSISWSTWRRERPAPARRRAGTSWCSRATAPTASGGTRSRPSAAPASRWPGAVHGAGDRAAVRRSRRRTSPGTASPTRRATGLGAGPMPGRRRTGPSTPRWR